MQIVKKILFVFLLICFVTYNIHYLMQCISSISRFLNESIQIHLGEIISLGWELNKIIMLPVCFKITVELSAGIHKSVLTNESFRRIHELEDIHLLYINDILQDGFDGMVQTKMGGRHRYRTVRCLILLDSIRSGPTGLCVINRPTGPTAVGRSESLAENIPSVPSGRRALYWPTGPSATG